MRELTKGLIVSCCTDYCTEGRARDTIASVAHHIDVVGLRVEGLENIKYARRVAPEKFIIGFVKVRRPFAVLRRHSTSMITPRVSDADAIKDAGADMVDSAYLRHWLGTRLTICQYGIEMLWSVMVELNSESYSEYFYSGPAKFRVALRQELRLGNIVLGVTARELLKQVKSDMPFAKVNLYVGVGAAEDIRSGFDDGADYVTIGERPGFALASLEASSHHEDSDTIRVDLPFRVTPKGYGQE